MTRKTLLSFPPPRHPDDQPPTSEIIYFSVFPDAVVWDPEALWEGEES
jgi:hypothetical protein